MIRNINFTNLMFLPVRAETHICSDTSLKVMSSFTIISSIAATILKLVTK